MTTKWGIKASAGVRNAEIDSSLIDSLSEIELLHLYVEAKRSVNKLYLAIEERRYNAED